MLRSAERDALLLVVRCCYVLLLPSVDWRNELLQPTEHLFCARCGFPTLPPHPCTRARAHARARRTHARTQGAVLLRKTGVVFTTPIAPGTPTAAALSPDGLSAAIGFQDFTVKVYSVKGDALVEEGKLEARVRSCNDALTRSCDDAIMR